MSRSTAGVGPERGELREDAVAELVTGAGERERSVRVQALEAAGAPCAADTGIELGPDPPLLRVCGCQARAQLLVDRDRPCPAFDTTGRLHSRDRRDEVAAGHPVLG